MPLAVQALRAALVKLEVPGAKAGVHLVETDALKWLQASRARSLDIVFIDPPFGSRLETQAMTLLVDREPGVRAAAWSISKPREIRRHFIPGLGWEILKDQTLGEVRMLLLKKIDTGVKAIHASSGHVFAGID